MNRVWSLVVVLVTALAASPSFACAVCGGAKSDNDWAFGITTLILSGLPPILFAAGMFFIIRAHRRAAREDASILPPAE